jgi:GNAT superfamily N-acetyltransferase
MEILPLEQRPELIPVCAAWNFGEWGCLYGEHSLESAVKDFTEAASGLRLPATWVCVAEGKPAGMASLSETDHPDRKDLSPWMASVYVHPQFRGRGIAEALCRAVAAGARERGFEEIHLFTGNAAKLYERLGWRHAGQLRDPSGAGTETVLMTLAL